jgi:hypothetical protein
MKHTLTVVGVSPELRRLRAEIKPGDVVLSRKEAEITDRLYFEYRNLRKMLFADLQKHHPALAPQQLLVSAQVILDRTSSRPRSASA